MTIDEKLDVVRKALEQGASVSLYFNECESEAEAEEAVRQLEMEYKYESSEQHKWLNVEYETDKGIELEAAAFY